MSAAPSSLPDPGVSAPWETISKDDLGGLVAVMTAVSLSLVLVAFCIRVYIRHTLKLSELMNDEICFVAATVCLTVSCNPNVGV